MQIGVGEGFEKTKTPVFVNIFENSRVMQLAAGLNSACITEHGELYLWGRGVWGENPFPSKVLTISNKVVNVSLGGDLGVVVDETGLAWVWGSNSNGELAVGDKEPRVHPFPILNMNGKHVTKAQCGHNFVISLGNHVRKEMEKQTNREKKRHKSKKSLLRHQRN